MKIENKKFGIEILVDLKNSKESYFPFEVKESKRSKKVKWKYASSLEKIKKYFNRLVQFEIENVERKENRKKAKKEQKEKFLNSLKIGSILAGSWGYDQTNVDFFEVIEIKGSKIKIQELGHVIDDSKGSGNGMACYVKPGKKLDRDPTTHLVTGDRVRIHSSLSVGLWSGESKYKSWYA